MQKTLIVSRAEQRPKRPVIIVTYAMAMFTLPIFGSHETIS